MTAQDQFLAVILLWIMAPLLMIAVLLAPLALVTMLEHGRRALRHGVDIMRHAYARGE